MAEVFGSLSPPDSGIPFGLTQEEYQVNYWPVIQTAIQYLLAQPEGCSSLSYERIYGSVYSCVCRHYGEQLFRDLCCEVSRHFSVVKAHLLETREEEVISAFDCILHQFKNALDGILPLFNCMNRFYLGVKLETDLKTELSNMFISIVANEVAPRLFGALEKAHNVPFTADPATMARVVKGLHCLNKEYVQMAPAVFARYIPNVLPPMQLSDLPSALVETQQFQEHLRSVGFLSGDQSRKRAGEETRVPSSHASEY